MRKFDIVLSPSEWESLRPTIKMLQREKTLKYEPCGYYDKVLIICECTEDAEKIIDNELEKILG